MSSYITSSSLTTTLSNYITSSSLTTTLSSYITSSSLTTTLSNYITSSSLTTTLTSYEPLITTSTNLSINNLTVGGYATLPCIIRNQTTLVTIAGNTTTTLLFPSLVASIGNMGLYYNSSNGVFTNLSGVNLSFNVSCRIPWVPGGAGYRNAWIQHSNSNYGRVGEMTVTNQTTTANCVLNISANVILVPNDYFYISIFQTSGGSLSLNNTAGNYPNITIR